MGKQFAVGSMVISAITGPAVSIMVSMVVSTSATLSVRRPAAPKASASLTKSGSESMWLSA